MWSGFSSLQVKQILFIYLLFNYCGNGKEAIRWLAEMRKIFSVESATVEVFKITRIIQMSWIKIREETFLKEKSYCSCEIYCFQPVSYVDTFPLGKGHHILSCMITCSIKQNYTTVEIIRLSSSP